MDIYGKLEIVLSAEKSYHIFMGFEYDIQLLRPLAQKYGKTAFVRLIEPVPASNGNKIERFNGCFNCENCNDFVKKTYSKTKFISEICDNENLICDKCEKQFQAASAVTEKETQFIDTELNAAAFVELFCNPNKSWCELNKGNVPHMAKIYRDCNTDIISEALKNMEYKLFLKTPYWTAISYFVKYKAGFECTLCDSKTNLETHHKTYKNHGRELEAMEDLVCLCRNCHSKQHQK